MRDVRSDARRWRAFVLAVAFWVLATDGAALADDGRAALVLATVNRARAEQGLGVLRLDPRLSATAEEFARKLATLGVLDHAPGAGERLAERVERNGYRWRALAENLLAGIADPDRVVATWMESAPHRANILLPEAGEAGIGVFADSERGPVWVLILGRAAP